MRRIKKIGSLKVTLFLLFALAFSSMLGTIIAQGQEDRFFNSLYYNILLFALILNLFICMANSFRVGLLKNRRKLAIFLLHLGVLVVFLGALISKFTKQAQYYTLLPGEKIVLIDEKIELLFEEFSIEYYPKLQLPKEYKSRIALFENGVLKSRHFIRVNNPLKYKGFHFHQSSFDVLADVDIEIKHAGKVLFEGNWKHGELLQITGNDLLKFKMEYFLPDAVVDDKGNISLRSYKSGNSALLISVYNKEKIVYEQWKFPNAETRDFHESEIGAFEFDIKGIKPVYTTIIQVIKDPGFSFVMGGFFMLFSGMLLLLIRKK